jgi:hypothetical protein
LLVYAIKKVVKFNIQRTFEQAYCQPNYTIKVERTPTSKITAWILEVCTRLTECFRRHLLQTRQVSEES